MQQTPLNKMFWLMLILGLVFVIPAVVAIIYLDSIARLEGFLFFCFSCLIISVPVMFILIAIALRKTNNEIFEEKLSVLNYINELHKELKKNDSSK